MTETFFGINLEESSIVQIETVHTDTDEYNSGNNQNDSPSNNAFVILNENSTGQVADTDFSRMNIDNFQFSLESKQEIYHLLKSWNLEVLYHTCIENFVDVDALKHMKNYFKMEFFKKLPIGLQIKLDYNLTKWQEANLEVNTSTIQEDPCFRQDPLRADAHPSTSKGIPTSAHYDDDNNKLLNLDINSLLNQSHTGLQIKAYYQTHSVLSDTLRNLLVTNVSQYLISNNIKMSVETAKNIASKVISVFPKECMEVYYFKLPGEKPMGKIYSNYFNQIRSLQNAGLRKKRCLANSEELNPKRSQLILNVEKNIEENLREIGKDNCSWAEMELHYCATSNYRIEQIMKANSTSEILQKWVQYKKPYGFKLIEIDFKTMYPDAESIEGEFQLLALNIMEIFDRKIKDKNAKSIVENVKQNKNISENGFHASILHLLHYVLVPTSRLVKTVNGEKSCSKISIKDSQQSFMLVGATAQNIEELLQKKLDEGVSIQPLIVIKGSFENPEEIFVYFDGIKYQIYSIIRAIEICFKLFYVLNLDFPSPSILVWSFIKQFFFACVANDRNKKHPAVGNLISELKKK